MMLTPLAAALIVSVSIQLASAAGGSWSYDDHHGNGPSSWSDSYPQCKGSKQSPINIEQSKTMHDTQLGEILFKGYDSSAGNSYRIANNGHTVQLSVQSGIMTIEGGGLPAKYQLAQFHVHWGSSNDVGSEHLVDGKFYPLEIHLVHFKSDYTNITEALKHSDGLAVLGIFAQVGQQDHPTLNKFTDNFDKVKYADTDVAIDAFALQGLLPTNTKAFTRYEGSLTTPGCLEIVTWTVFQQPINISQTQLNKFRALNHNKAALPEERLVNNYRPVLPVNSRIVKRSYEFQAASSGYCPSASAFGSTLAMAIALFLFR